MNIRNFYLRQFFSELMPIYPLYMLMFEDRGLSVQQISVLIAIWSMTVVILEIPTGIMADRWNRRYLISLGSLFQAACYFVWLLAGSFFMFALGFVFWGVGGAFISGAEEALLFDSLKTSSLEDKFDVILGRGRFLVGIGTIIASICGGFIGLHFGYAYALYLSIGSGLMASLIAFMYKEVNYYRNDNIESIQKNEKNNRNTLREALLFLIKNKAILIFSLLLITVVGIAGILDEYDQLIASSYGLNTVGIGIWAALRFLLIAFGGYLAHAVKTLIEKIIRKKDGINAIAVICLISAVCLLTAGLIKGVAIMGIYGLFYLMMSSGDVLGEDYIQSKIDGEGRSTVHSILSLTYNLFGSIFALFYGYSIKYTGLIGSLVWLAIYIMVLTFVYLILNYRVKRKSV